MNSIKNNGDYFVKDSEVQSSAKDEFRHIDIANNIISLIESEETPFNIAVVGRWGIGKSSLTKMVRQHFEKKKDEYVVEEINAWKYEKEALRRVFLKRILEKLDFKEKNYTEKLLNKLTSYTGTMASDMKFWDYVKEWLPLLGMAGLLYVAGILLSFLGTAIYSNISGGSFEGGHWFRFILTGFAQYFYIPILVVLIQQYIKGSSGRHRFKITPPITSTDEYEEELKALMKKNNKKIITVIDDLDRLTPDKIVEALDAIKAFVNYDKCVFIVPFDDTVLKKALERKTISLVKNEHLLIESELFLDKLFQYKVYLPNVIASDLPQYAVDLVKAEAPDLYKLFDREQFDHIAKEVLIHKGVSTPRQVKKIINTFSHHVLLAVRRESERVPQNIFLSPHNMRVLAKVSVIQADFSDFYYKMFDNPSIVSEFMEFANDYKAKDKVPEAFEPYFIVIKKVNGEEVTSITMSKSAESLYMFLSRTSNIVCKNYAPFLYMDYDSVSAIFGDELSRDLRNALTSGASEIVIDRLEKNKDKDLSELLYNILIYADVVDYAKCCEMLIDIHSEYNLTKNEKLLELIAHRVSALYETGLEFKANGISFEYLCEFKKLVTDKAGITKAISSTILTEDESTIDRLTYFFAHHDDFDADTQAFVSSYINSDLGTEGKLSIDKFCRIESLDVAKHFADFLRPVSLLSKLADAITKADSYNETDMDIVFLRELLEKHIEEKRFRAAIQSLLLKLSDEDLLVTISNSIIEAKEQLDVHIGTEIFAKIIEYKDSDNKKIANSLLTEIEWTIKTKTDEQADTYLSSILSDENIGHILKNVATRKQISSIPQTIEEINNSFLTKPIDYDVLEAIQGQYTAEQRTQIITTVSNQVPYNQNQSGQWFDFIRKAIESFSKDEENHNLINSLITAKLYTGITQHANVPDYSNAAASILPSVLPSIDDAYVKHFITWSTTASYITSYPLLSIKIMDVFNEHLTEQNHAAFISIMNLTDSSLSSSILRLLRLVRETFTDKSNVLSKYRDYLISKLQDDNARKDVIANIDWFESIGTVGAFVKEGIKYADINEAFIKASIKFFGANEDASLVIKEVLPAIKPTEVATLHTILKDLNADNSYVNEYIRDCSEKDSIEFVFNLLVLKICYTTSIDDDVSKISAILFKIGDSSVVKRTIEKLSTLSASNIIATEKRAWGDRLYNVFRTSQEDTQKAIYAFVVKIGVKTQFRKDTTQKVKDFTEDETLIIKSIK